MQDVDGVHTSGSGESGEGGEPKPRKRRRTIRQLLGAPKRHADRKASQARKIDPEQQRAKWRAAKARQFAKAAQGEGSPAAEAGASESVLEVKPEVAPPPKAEPVPKASVDQLCELMFTFHMLGSKILRIEELALSKVEADTLGTAAANVARHYQWSGMAEKTKDWLTLAGVTVVIYHPRLDAARKRVLTAKKEKLAATQSTGGIQMPPKPPDEVHIQKNPQFSPDPASEEVHAQT